MKKKIIIKTNDLNEMYKLYKKYKGVRYKNTEFTYEGENEDIKEIVNVLNKKTRMQRLAYIFDKSCEQVDKKFEGKNKGNIILPSILHPPLQSGKKNQQHL